MREWISRWLFPHALADSLDLRPDPALGLWSDWQWVG